MAEKKSRHHFHQSAQIPSAKMPVNWTQLCMYTDPHLIELLIYTEFLIVKTPLFLPFVPSQERRTKERTSTIVHRAKKIWRQLDTKE
jgi:hypothetical protein